MSENKKIPMYDKENNITMDQYIAQAEKWFKEGVCWNCGIEYNIFKDENTKRWIGTCYECGSLHDITGRKIKQKDKIFLCKGEKL